MSEQKDKTIKVNGITVKQSEIQSVTIKRGGVEITIPKSAEEQQKIGFAR